MGNGAWERWKSLQRARGHCEVMYVHFCSASAIFLPQGSCVKAGRDAVPRIQGGAASAPHGPLSLPWSSPSHLGNTHPQAPDWQFFLFPFLLHASLNTTQNSPLSPHSVVPAPDAMVLTLNHHQSFRERQKKKKIWLSSRRHPGSTFGLASARSCSSLQRGIWVVTASHHLCACYSSPKRRQFS